MLFEQDNHYSAFFSFFAIFNPVYNEKVTHILLVIQERGDIMATLISIGTTQNFEQIRTRLGQEFQKLQDDGLKVILAESNVGSYKFVDCSIIKGTRPEEEMILKHYVANALSDFILGYWENVLLNKITRKHYYYLTNDEKENVLNKARAILETYSKSSDDMYLYRLNRKSKILHKILDHLSISAKINIEGFIKFRLQDYVTDLCHVLEQAVDEFMLEKEYHEFILLLKYFVDIQEPKVKKVHVVLLYNGAFQLFDDYNRIINNECLEGCIVEMVDNEINYEDLLISTLITIAPKEIVLHVGDPAKVVNTVNTIQGVFGERAMICYGCPRCNRTKGLKH